MKSHSCYLRVTLNALIVIGFLVCLSLSSCQVPASSVGQSGLSGSEAPSTVETAVRAPSEAGIRPVAQANEGPNKLLTQPLIKTPPDPSATAHPQASPNIPDHLKSLRLAAFNQTFFAQGEQRQLKVLLLNQLDQELAQAVDLIWSSSQPQNFSVDAQGLVTALVERGKAEILVRAQDSDLEARVTVQINLKTQGGGGGGSTASGNTDPQTTAPPQLTQLLTASQTGGKAILKRGESLVIQGNHFEANHAQNEVRFILANQTTVLAQPQSSSSGELHVLVPDEVQIAGDIQIQVKTQGRLSNILLGYMVPVHLSLSGRFE